MTKARKANCSTLARFVLSALLVPALTACGGSGGSGSSAIVSTPPPPSAPPLSPATPLIFPNVTGSTQFATLGYESPGHPIQVSSLVGDGFSVRYDAAANVYLMDVPASVEGVFQANSMGDRYWNGQLRDPSAAGSLQPVFVNVFRPGPQNFDFSGLTYTSFAEYETSSGRFGEMAFGTATPASAIPISGSATYAAFAAGQTDLGFAIRGDVNLAFNFGAGTLSGSFDPYIYDLLSGHTPLGRFEFVNTIYSVGSPSFSGQLSLTGLAQRGTFEGLFTGPNAQELMARWTAPIPGTTSQMFGVWVGKQCC